MRTGTYMLCFIRIISCTF